MSARKRTRLRSEQPTLAPSIDHLVRRLERDQLETWSVPVRLSGGVIDRAGTDPCETCSPSSPAWSTHSNLLAVAAPPPQQSSSTSWLDSLVYGERLPTTATTSGTPSIHLTHFSGAEAATPRVRISLPVPVPSSSGPASAAPTGSSPRVTHLSFSPDSSHLVAVVNRPARAPI